MVPAPASVPPRLPPPSKVIDVPAFTTSIVPVLLNTGSTTVLSLLPLFSNRPALVKLEL